MATSALPSSSPSWTARLAQQGDILLALGVFSALAILLVPLPPILLDMMLAGSITLSMLVFLVAIYATRPVDFSIFPTVLLITTVFRLSLNVASTRLILLHGAEGPQAAGHVIQAFGAFVVGGNYVVGFILFSILIVINFIVITKGAGRVAEVAARFTLDALPGKQMAIDAELNAGLIDEKIARRRRAELSREMDFYGAMDGASKFIKGDAIAAIIITLINIVGGVVIGVVMGNLDIGEAFSYYTILTIGDGLASQIPALITSAAAGMLVTRVSDPDARSLDAQLSSQMLSNPRVIATLAAMSAGFMIIPGLRPVFAALTVALAGLAYVLQRQQDQEVVNEDGTISSPSSAPSVAQEAPIEDLLRVEPLVVELSLDMLPYVDPARGGQLVERIQKIRKAIAQELGVVVPPVQVRDNLRLLGPGQYRVLLRGETIGESRIVPRQNLALNPGSATPGLPGTPGIDPVFGLKGVWIPDNLRLRAQAMGYTVVDVATVLTTHFDDLFRRHAHELYGRQQLADTLERISKENPRLVEDLIPDLLSRSSVLRVLRNLIQEGVGVRDTQWILEALAEVAGKTKDPEMLTELVRQRMARTITARFTAEDGRLRYLALAPELEDAILRGLQGGEGGLMNLHLDPELTRRFIQVLKAHQEGYTGLGEPILLVPPLARGPVRRLLEKALPRLAVLSPGEIVPTTQVERVGEVSVSDKARSPLKGVKA